MEDLHIKILPYEDIITQSNLKGYYEKRHNLDGEIYNHRKIAVNEIVIDIDIHARRISNEVVNAICSRLIADNLSYTLWDTSRSPHIHIFFKDMQKYPKEIRKQIRKEFLNHYCKGYAHYIDFAKCSENVMIREFNGLHEKTGKRKVCIEQFKSDLNNVPAFIVDKVMNVPINERKPFNVPIKGELTAFISYCLNNRFDREGGRNQILFKNFAIAIYLLGIDLDKAKPYFKQLADNCKGKRADSLIGWYKWAEKKKEVSVSFNELKRGNFYVKL